MDIIRRDTAPHYREVRKILKGNMPEYQYELEESPKHVFSAFAVGISMVIAMLLLLFAGKAQAQDINLDIIADIESSHEPLAYNRKSGATGEYQIKPIVLKDYNANNDDGYHYKYSIDDMYNPTYARLVSGWYINYQIPLYINRMKIPDTPMTRLIAYNFGIGNLRHWFKHGSHWNRLPLETRNYIRRYYKETKGEYGQ